jgi:hypothetical protein
MAPRYHIGYIKIGNLWYATDGRGGMVGNGAASSNTSSSYYHWGYYNVETMGTYPAYTCAKATSTYTYTGFGGNPDNFTQVKTAAMYSSNTSTNTYGWLAQACTTSLPFVCEMPRWGAMRCRAHAPATLASHLPCPALRTSTPRRAAAMQS